jgi:LTXXQ motif family protein
MLMGIVTDGSEMIRCEGRRDDFAAFTDARIAALKVGLRLTPAQEKNWPALETALREQAKARGARIAEWHEKAKEPREHHGVPVVRSGDLV